MANQLETTRRVKGLVKITRSAQISHGSTAADSVCVEAPFDDTDSGALSSLDDLLGNLSPKLWQGEYVFALTKEFPMCDVIASIREDEGLSVIVRRQDADRLGIGYDYVASRITLMVNSSLHTVGLTAAISSRLADAGVSCNVVAGLNHDHLFVPSDRADNVIGILANMSKSARRRVY